VQGLERVYDVGREIAVFENDADLVRKVRHLSTIPMSGTPLPWPDSSGRAASTPTTFGSQSSFCLRLKQKPHRPGFLLACIPNPSTNVSVSIGSAQPSALFAEDW